MTAERIFGCSHEFVARDRELGEIIAAAHSGRDLALLAAPGAGASELLRQAYDELFHSDAVTPFYFELKASDGDARSAALRFASEFITQTVAFSRKDPHILWSRPTLNELSRFASLADALWVDGAIDAIANGSVESLVAIPARASSGVCVLIDSLDRSRLIRDGERFIECVSLLASGRVSVIGGGLRRAIYGHLPFRHLDLDPLTNNDSAAITQAIASKHGLEISDATRDLIAVQTEGSAAAIALLIRQAADDEEDLTAFAGVERTYTNSVVGGLLNRDLRARALELLPTTVDRNEVISLLRQNFAAKGMQLSLGHWRRALDRADAASFEQLIRHLHVEEVISAGDGMVDMSATCRVIRDFVEARFRILAAPDKRGPIVGHAVQSNLARATGLMAEAYRTLAALGVRNLLGSFSGQSIAAAAVDYGTFKQNFKGQADEINIAALSGAKERVNLPRIIYTADAAEYYPPLSEIADKNRSAVGLADSEEAWLIAEIDSKLEADAEITEFWCDRLEMAAVNSGLDNFRIWLIAPEGFSDEALAVLIERNAYGSSRKQIELLRSLLDAPPAHTDSTATTYEITVPMGDEGELLAARTLTKIQESHDLPPKPVSQIKTALIEALINAAEHSLSPDRTVRVLLVVSDKQLTITLQNRGLKLTDDMLAQADLSSERRGWGLELIRRLMDEVRVEPTDDGTRLVMSKNFFQQSDSQS